MDSRLSVSQYDAVAGGVAFGITDVGTVRTSNQDAFLVAPGLGLLVVADGMGGHAAGEVASAEALRLLCDRLAHGLPDPDATWSGPTPKATALLHDAVVYANAQLYMMNAAQGHGEGLGMGTTLTGIWRPSPAGPLFVFHVGDSRVYRWRAGTLTRLTRDQTLYQQALDLAAPPPLPPRNLLLQAIGPAAHVDPELSTHATAQGDVYLLCSDGLYGESSADDIAAVLAHVRGDNLHDCCRLLVEMAKRDGSRDNITALLLRCTG